MSSPSRTRGPFLLTPQIWILAAALMFSACATGGASRPDQSVDRDPTGFTITEDVQVTDELRESFREAVARLQQGQYEQGIALLTEITQQAPTITAAYIDLGIAYGRLDDLERAEASLKKALELNPHHPVAYHELGIVYRKTGRFEDARKSYEKALDLHPDFHFARKNLAILCDVYLGDLTCALEQYELYAKAVPEDPAAAIWIADLQNRTEGR